MRIRYALLGFVLLATVGMSTAKAGIFADGAISSKVYLDIYGESARLGYLIGILDGMRTAYILDPETPSADLIMLIACVSAAGLGEFQPIFDRWLTQNIQSQFLPVNKAFLEFLKTVAC